MNQNNLTPQVLERFAKTPDPRLREIMQSLTRHLHAFVKDVALSEEEWFTAIQFLTATGQICDGTVRQEFILLSDTLGVTMLVDEINHHKSPNATDSTVFGPFYISGMPERAYGENMAMTFGKPALIHGQVRASDGTPLSGVALDVWQTAENGMYSGQDTAQPHGNLRGCYRSDVQGNYAIRTIVPVPYPIPDDGPVGKMLNATARSPWRPAHLHFMLTAPGYQRLVTHLFNTGDPYLAADPVFGVKPSLLVDYVQRPVTHPLAERFGFQEAFYEVRYDFVLDRISS